MDLFNNIALNQTEVTIKNEIRELYRKQNKDYMAFKESIIEIIKQLEYRMLLKNANMNENIDKKMHKIKQEIELIDTKLSINPSKLNDKILFKDNFDDLFNKNYQKNYDLFISKINDLKNELSSTYKNDIKDSERALKNYLQVCDTKIEAVRLENSTNIIEIKNKINSINNNIKLDLNYNQFIEQFSGLNNKLNELVCNLNSHISIIYKKFDEYKLQIINEISSNINEKDILNNNSATNNNTDNKNNIKDIFIEGDSLKNSKLNNTKSETSNNLPDNNKDIIQNNNHQRNDSRIIQDKINSSLGKIKELYKNTINSNNNLNKTIIKINENKNNDLVIDNYNTIDINFKDKQNKLDIKNNNKFDQNIIKNQELNNKSNNLSIISSNTNIDSNLVFANNNKDRYKLNKKSISYKNIKNNNNDLLNLFYSNENIINNGINDINKINNNTISNQDKKIEQIFYGTSNLFLKQNDLKILKKNILQESGKCFPNLTSTKIGKKLFKPIVIESTISDKEKITSQSPYDKKSNNISVNLGIVNYKNKKYFNKDVNINMSTGNKKRRKDKRIIEINNLHLDNNNII